ncbi:MAG: bifunctional acetate--CoA ligase family protein/GNAT family N-acetyltransferase [Proteobacteria bacterium]|nr:bifunctional acetate--CoA ligase family protein/GNAT family N-acetyltransferase [Pseudomonadota bacterium]
MGVDNLDKIFQPKSIAVIGASEKKESVGFAIMKNLINGKYQGNLYPVHPSHKVMWGLKAYPSIADIDAAVDLAVIAIPIAYTPKIVNACAKSGVGGAVIISAGGKETGQKGKEIENAIKKEAESSGIRIIGPNCLGVVCTKSNLNASFAGQMPIMGKMAFISQSGAICSSVMDLSIKEQIGFSYFVSVGSMLDVDFGDMIDFIGQDPNVGSIVMYVENLTNIRYLMSAARAVSRIKPIIALKSGRTRAGAAAAASHTGALAGEDDIYDAAFKRAGIVRVKTFEELFDCAELLAKKPHSSGPNLAIITNAGGLGVMAVDALSDYGMEPIALSAETIQKLDEVLPHYWSHSNPIDLIGDADHDRYLKAVKICIDAPEIDGLLVILVPQGLNDPENIAKMLADFLKNNPFPVFTSWLGGAGVEKGRQILNDAGIPTFDTPERAVRAFMDLDKHAKNIEMLQEIPARLPGKLNYNRETAAMIIKSAIENKQFLLNEVEAKSLLLSYGIPTNQTELVNSAKEAVQKAKEIGFPVAMKICSKDVIHKTSVNGIRLGLNSVSDVEKSYENILSSCLSCKPEAKIDGVTIQPMLQRPDFEVILGIKKDREFGPVILFGMGGIMTEVLKDRAIAFPPLNRLLARRLMEETKVYRVLKGQAANNSSDLYLLEEILMRLAQLAADFPEIEELDINPIFFAENSACAVDARVIIKPAETKAPMHLIISPYPNQHESHITIGTDISLFVRPIRPEDAILLEELFKTLSPQSIYFRFFAPIKYISPTMLARFTQIDYDREIALVAILESGNDEKIVGVARVISQRNPKHAEFAVLVGDNWHGKGIGATLLRRCLNIAKDHGIEKVWGTVLAENTQMLAMGKKLGFKIERVPDENEYQLIIDLTKPYDIINK